MVICLGRTLNPKLILLEKRSINLLTKCRLIEVFCGCLHSSEVCYFLRDVYNTIILCSEVLSLDFNLVEVSKFRGVTLHRTEGSFVLFCSPMLKSRCFGSHQMTIFLIKIEPIEGTVFFFSRKKSKSMT